MTTRKKPESVNLSDTRVARLKRTGKLYRVWDSVVPGFHVQVTPAGAKSYRVQFQRKNGDKVAIPIGDAEVWNIETAREKAKEHRQAHDNGVDVRAKLKEDLGASNLLKLVERWQTDRKPKLKKSSQASYESILKTTILPALGKRLVKDMTRKDVSELHSKASKKHKTNANRAVAVLSSLLKFAQDIGWRKEGSPNPCRGLTKNQEKPRSRVLSATEYATLEASITALVKKTKLDSGAGDLIRFLALSGLRKGEVLGLKFADVDVERDTLRFEDHKTAAKVGAKVLPLNAHLKAIIQRRASDRISAFVFPGWTENGPVVGLAKMWTRLMGEAGIADVTPHDLRRTFMSVCTELGYPASIGDSLLGHSLGRIRDTYINLGSEGIMATASKETSAWIAAAMAGEKVKPGVKIEDKKIEATA